MELYYFYRELELANIQIIFVLFLILFLTFIRKAYDQEDLSLGIYNIGLASFFLCNALNFIFRFLDLYYTSYIYGEILTYSRIVIMIGVTSLIATFELSKILKSKGLVTLSFIFVTIISNTIAPMSITITFIASIMHVIVSMVFFYFVIKEKGVIRYQAFFTGLGILLVLLGATLRPTDLQSIFPNLVQIFSQNLRVPVVFYPFLLIYVGIMLMVIFEVNFIIRLQWMNKIRSIYLLTQNGTILLEKHYTKQQKKLKGSLEKRLDIKDIFNKINEQNKIQRIDQNGLKILLAYGKYIVGIIIATEGLSIISNKLNEYINDFEQLFRDILPTLEEINPEIFKPGYKLLDRHFSPTLLLMDYHLFLKI